MNTLLNISLGEFFSSFFASVKTSFSEFSIADAIDIFIISIILFFAIKFFKSRKAGALLIGVAIVVILMLLADYFELEATYFILHGIVDMGVLAIIIIFQPEIRDALEKVGSGSLSGILTLGDQNKHNMVYSKAIDQVCSAITDLSASKTGAIIVISRTTKLDEIVETGITINADVNSLLIRNLFFNKAPLHDGAVVIDDARIVAAGCLLPLTRRNDVDGDLGTRHRAAIGMSETSDAVVIVVSEETGTISVAYDCVLTRNYTPETLRRFLMKKILKSTQIDNEN